MSNFLLRTKNPETGEFETAEWLDNHFGPHAYGVRFPSTGRIYRERGRYWEFEQPTTPPAPGKPLP